MFICKVFILCVLICTTLAAEQNDSCSPNQNTLRDSVDDYPVRIPRQVLKQLTDTLGNSKGLFKVWQYAFQLTKDELLKEKYAQMKFQVCRGILFIEPPECPRNATTCVKRSQLVNYYNELVIQLRIAERLLNTRITTEILEEKRNEVEKNETKIIELLRGSILPLLNIALNKTSDEMNCNCTEQIVDQKMLVYSQCASIQTANLLLSNTVLYLQRILNSFNKARMTNCIDYSSEANEVIISDYDGTEEWCILQ